MTVRATKITKSSSKRRRHDSQELTCNSMHSMVNFVEMSTTLLVIVVVSLLEHAAMNYDIGATLAYRAVDK